MGCAGSRGPALVPRNAVQQEPNQPSILSTEVHDVPQSLSKTIDQISHRQTTMKRKITQASYGFIMMPENFLDKHLQEQMQREQQQNQTEEELSSGLVYKQASGNIDNPERVFGIIKRGEIPQFEEFMRKHYFNVEHKVHELRGMWNSTPLVVALQYNQPRIADLLLQHPPHDVEELNRPNEKGYTPIVFAVMEGYVEIVKRLLSLNVRIDIAPTLEPLYNPKHDLSIVATPLMMAVMNDHRRILGLLIDGGCSVDEIFAFPTIKGIKKLSGTTSAKVTGVRNMRPILLACAYGHDQIVRELLWRACDFRVCDSEQSNVLHHLVRAKANAEEVYKVLQSKSCIDDVLLSGTDENGDCPLHVACDIKAVGIARMLLDDGADASKLNLITGFTPLHIAIKRRDTEMVQLLLQYGANPLRRVPEDSTAVNKLTPLETAAKLPPDSEIVMALTNAAKAWDKMRHPLRKSIINLFPDSDTPSRVLSPHSKPQRAEQQEEEEEVVQNPPISPTPTKTGAANPSSPVSIANGTDNSTAPADDENGVRDFSLLDTSFGGPITSSPAPRRALEAENSVEQEMAAAVQNILQGTDTATAVPPTSTSSAPVEQERTVVEDITSALQLIMQSMETEASPVQSAEPEQAALSVSQTDDAQQSTAAQASKTTSVDTSVVPKAGSKITPKPPPKDQSAASNNSSNTTSGNIRRRSMVRAGSQGSATGTAAPSPSSSDTNSTVAVAIAIAAATATEDNATLKSEETRRIEQAAVAKPPPGRAPAGGNGGRRPSLSGANKQTPAPTRRPSVSMTPKK